ncbi:MobF family relaxase [Burkholderia vietnamiensis]|uniref:MobF family relaxase n=1 Tax=Burkholderia vietnamiensis TaxID=60552 RepID=UPI0020134996|nr:MobF family relaxase [Burkholderia vietnamiensis]
MLSIVKINSAKNQAAQGSEGYLAYLGAPSTRERSDFDDYARGNDRSGLGPLPFWACSGPALLGLDPDRSADPEHVDRLARGFHPLDGQALVEGAGDSHVMGVDMTFSAPKDVSAIFAAADRATQAQILDCLHDAVRAALAHAEAHAVTRHGHGGRAKKKAEAAVAACYTHFASRALDPQLHVHAFMFNVGKRAGADEWSALEHKAQFDRKMATGALFRVELAARLRAMGFAIAPTGPYFQIVGVSDEQREALSTRSREIAQQVAEMGDVGEHGEAAKDVAAINTRSAKSEPPLPQLLDRFARQTAALGLTPEAVTRMREPTLAAQANASTIPPAAPQTVEPKSILAAGSPEFALDHAALLAKLTERQSCATPQDALALICEASMGQWDAARCLEELDRFMASEHPLVLGETETLAPVFTSRATLDMEARATRTVHDGKTNLRHRLSASTVNKRFDALEADLGSKLGAAVSLDEQRAAALHVASETGAHAFVEGWAGTGKTTLLRALADAYKESGFSVLGCAQSASAAQNLSRETSIPSRTIASLLLAIQSGRLTLNDRSVLVLDEAGMVGSREFALVQQAAVDSGAKFIAVGDPKQLQPIEAGGIFRALVREHGAAEISTIRRQRTDFEPLFEWLAERARERSIDPAAAVVEPEALDALRSLPDDAKMRAAEALCSVDPTLRRGFHAWRARYDHEWMRDAVESLAIGAALPALCSLDAHQRLRLSGGPLATVETLLDEWTADKTPLAEKIMIAATRAEVADLNARARTRLVEHGIVLDSKGVELEITHRDESKEAKRFAPGDRVVFTKNDKTLGVANGSTGTIQKIQRAAGGPALIVELDAPNERGETTARVPASFGRFDHAYCLTNHKSQGRTLSSAHVLVNPAMADREWIYVASSRSRFATTLHVDRGAILSADPESHLQPNGAEPDRPAVIECLARSMSRSRAKGTTLDYAGHGNVAPARIANGDRGVPCSASVEAAARDPGSPQRRGRIVCDQQAAQRKRQAPSSEADRLAGAALRKAISRKARSIVNEREPSQ